jgi:hypothetical protein
METVGDKFARQCPAGTKCSAASGNWYEDLNGHPKCRFCEDIIYPDITAEGARRLTRDVQNAWYGDLESLLRYVYRRGWSDARTQIEGGTPAAPDWHFENTLLDDLLAEGES